MAGTAAVAGEEHSVESSPSNDNGTGVSMDATRRDPEGRDTGLSPGALYRRFAAECRPKPWLYWIDTLGCAALGWSAFAVAVSLGPASSLGAVAAVVAVFALYRAALFVHELAHLRAGAVPGYEVAWHLAVGLPLLVPGLMYVGSHNEHHKRSVFGTVADPEYEPMALWSIPRILLSGLPLFVVPLLLVLRWGVLGPLSYLISPLRPLVVGRLSTLIINVRYYRPLPQGEEVRRWALQEAGTAFVVWAVAAALWAGRIGAEVVQVWYAVTLGLLAVNLHLTEQGPAVDDLFSVIECERVQREPQTDGLLILRVDVARFTDVDSKSLARVR